MNQTDRQTDRMTTTNCNRSTITDLSRKIADLADVDRQAKSANWVLGVCIVILRINCCKWIKLKQMTYQHNQYISFDVG